MQGLKSSHSSTTLRHVGIPEVKETRGPVQAASWPVVVGLCGAAGWEGPCAEQVLPSTPPSELHLLGLTPSLAL